MTRWIRGSDISSVKASVWGTQPIHFNVYFYLWCAPSNLSCLTPVWTEQRRCELLFPMQPNTRSTCRIPALPMTCFTQRITNTERAHTLTHISRRSNPRQQQHFSWGNTHFQPESAFMFVYSLWKCTGFAG